MLPPLAVCPHLPVPARPLTAASIRTLGADRGPAFYFLALECAQALWQDGLPAQSLLLINRSFSADLQGDEPVLRQWPPPYAAAAWVMRHRHSHQFIGNPRRHYQHLATRMVAPRQELRTWRAWACWSLACSIFPTLPADEQQLAAENIAEPSLAQILSRLQHLGLPGEDKVWHDVHTSLASP